MAMTIEQLKDLVLLKLAGESDITASEHREVENEIINFLEMLSTSSAMVKSKVVILDTFSLDRNYAVTTTLPAGSVVENVTAMLVVKNANNGFAVGDVITAPTPYPNDSGRTAAQGIGVQYNASDSSKVYVMVNDQLTIMTPYNSGSGATANNIILSGGAASNWSIKLIITYI